MLKKIGFVITVFLFTFILYSCEEENDVKKEKNSDEQEIVDNNEDTQNKTEELPAVCIWNKLSVRETPQTKGKYKTAIYLGEKITYKGNTEIDSTSKKNIEFIQIELADGTLGWSDKRFIGIDATSYALIKDTKLYKRPDILTATTKTYNKLQFLIVFEEKNEWVKVKLKGSKENWFSEGWIKKDNLTDSEIDVSVAILASRAIAISNKDKKNEALNEIVNNPDLQSSIFISQLKDLIEENNMEDIELDTISD